MDGAPSPIRNDLIPASSSDYGRKYYDTSLHIHAVTLGTSGLLEPPLIDTAGDMSVDGSFSHPLPLLCTCLGAAQRI
jgi:hypothetical protein